jgi:hypothetical protein
METGERLSLAEANRQLSIDVEATFNRVNDMLEADAPPPRIVISHGAPRSPLSLRQDPVVDAFGYYQWQLPNAIHGRATAETVYINPANLSRSELETTLVHEFVHVVQRHQHGVPYANYTDYEQEIINQAITEGSAIYATDVYADRYLNRSIDQFSQLQSIFQDGSPEEQLLAAPYHYGAQYVASTIDSPSNLSKMYQDPPVDTSTIIHNETMEESQPLSISISTGSSWERDDRYAAWNVSRGELFVRSVLCPNLSTKETRVVADKLFSVTHTDESYAGIIWVIRWNDTNDLSTFGESLSQCIADRSRRDGSHVVGISKATTIVIVGDPSFVDAVSIGDSNATTSITID